jgi:hypothetical protein
MYWYHCWYRIRGIQYQQGTEDMYVGLQLEPKYLVNINLALWNHKSRRNARQAQELVEWTLQGNNILVDISLCPLESRLQRHSRTQECMVVGENN